MTRCGMVCCWVVLAVSIIGVLAGAGLQKRAEKKRPQHIKEMTRVPERDAGPFYTPPVIFRREEERIVTCKAATDMRKIYFEGLWGADEPEKRHAAGIKYAKQELAALLAEQALAAGGIRFYEEGGELRAELRALVSEGRRAS